jgi:hypothetical protein
LEDRAAGIATLDAAVDIVPMIEHADRDARSVALWQGVERRLLLDMAEEGEAPVQQSDIVVRGNDDAAAV